jgi:hypothetical protein
MWSILTIVSSLALEMVHPSCVMSQVIISTKMGSPTYPLAAVTVLRRQRSLDSLVIAERHCGSTTIGIHNLLNPTRES